MGRFVGTAVLILVLASALTVPALADESSPTVKLRGWYFGLQSSDTWQDTYHVYGRGGLPFDDLVENGSGGGLMFGHRFGGRFLLGLQLTTSVHDIKYSVNDILVGEALITGTVLYRQTSVLQPFLRGGFGAVTNILSFESSSDFLASYGTAAIAGGGLQVRLSSRFSLDLEAVATFANFLEVADRTEDGLWPEDKWQVRASSYGWRIGVGVMFWF